MRRFLAGFTLTFLALTVRGTEPTDIRVILKTSRGEIELTLDAICEARTTANFLR